MKPLLTAISAAALALMLAFPASAEEEVKVEGKVFSDPAAGLEAAPVKLHLDPSTLPVLESRSAFSLSDQVLPGLTAEEIKSLQQTDDSDEKGLRVGIGRELPDSFGDATGWNWVAVEGGKVAHLGVTSTGAVRIRAQLQVGELPEGVELRFFSPADTATVYGPFTRTELASQPKDADGNTLFWSPSVAGDTLKVEVFLPDPVQPAAISLKVPQLSHVVLDPATGKTQDGVLEANTAACYIDIACLSPEWQREGRSIGGYLFSDANGNSGFCSGTLVNTTAGNGVPYFLTANHCIDTTQEAASMNFVWQYANSGCGSNDAAQRAQFTYGGSKLLATDAGLDTTLVQLSAYPPSPSYFTGWATTPLTAQEGVAGIHHAAVGGGISPKLYSQGHFLGYKEVQGMGKLAAVQWTHGVTEAGGSGSGLWAAQQDGYYLKGLLSRGSVSCSNPTGTDLYTRMDQAYPILKPWLNPTR
jgi:hypothetical protein